MKMSSEMLYAKQYLKAAEEMNAERIDLEWEVKQLRADCEHVIASYNYCSGRKSANARRKEDLIARLVDTEQEMMKKIGRYWERIRETEFLIERIPDERHRIVLRLRYIRRMTWPEVQEELQTRNYIYEHAQLNRIHNAALCAFSTVMRENHIQAEETAVS